MKKGIFCFSLDLELIWGRFDLPNYQEFILKIAKERQVIDAILKLAKKYSIPITWATVGHLFLDKCNLYDKIKHTEITRPALSCFIRDRFELDPATNIKKDPIWYGTDIISKIKKNKIHEIGSHTFSHVSFGGKYCTAELAESEIRECVSLARKQGVRLSSFVFPYNSIGYLSVLKRYGFTAYRGVQENFIFKRGFIQKFFMLLDLLGVIKPFVSSPIMKDGLINIPASMYFISSRGLRRYIPKDVRFKKAKRGINMASKKKMVFHMWSHPIDFVDDSDHLLLELEKIFRYTAQLRDNGLIDTFTMGDIAKETRKFSY